MSDWLFIISTTGVGESAGYRSWVGLRLVGFLPRLKPWASSLYSYEATEFAEELGTDHLPNQAHQNIDLPGED